METLYKYAKFQYECGNYAGAAEYLYFFRVLVSKFFNLFTFEPFLQLSNPMIVILFHSSLRAVKSLIEINQHDHQTNTGIFL